MGCCTSAAPVANSTHELPPPIAADPVPGEPTPRVMIEVPDNDPSNPDTGEEANQTTASSNIIEEEEEEFHSERTEDEYVLPGYEFEKDIAKGSQGVVVQMKKDSVSYAVKICSLQKGLINFLNTTTRDPKEEAAILKRFDHPHVVKLFDFIDDTDNDRIYIVMELLSGGSIMNCESIDEKRNAFSQALAGLQYVHYQRIAHRDIKPDNILRHADGTIKLVDFGISVFVPEGETKIPGEISCTPCFAPPELLVSEDPLYDPFAADIWSLGITLYDLMFNKLPFDSKNRLELQNLIVNEEPVFPEDADPDAVDLIKGMLNKNPEERITIEKIWDHPFLNVIKYSMKSLLKVSSRIFESLSSSDTKNSVTRISRGSLRSSLRSSLRGSLRGSGKISAKKLNQKPIKSESKLSKASKIPPRPKKPVKPDSKKPLPPHPKKPESHLREGQVLPTLDIPKNEKSSDDKSRPKSNRNGVHNEKHQPNIPNRAMSIANFNKSTPSNGSRSKPKTSTNQTRQTHSSNKQLPNSRTSNRTNTSNHGKPNN